MSATVFKRHYGRIDVRFRQEKHDWLCMLVRAGSAGRVSCGIASSCCPFPSLVAWLEALTTGVPECAFNWEAEGLDGRLAWQRPELQLDWSHYRGTRSLRLQADRKQVVAAFYTAFRRFVESPEYDPFRYESMRLGDEFAHYHPNGLLEGEIMGQLLTLSAADAEAALQELRPMRPLGPGFPEVSYIKAGWDKWGVPRRRARLKEIFDWGSFAAFGSPLRRLRSPMIEAWLTP